MERACCGWSIGGIQLAMASVSSKRCGEWPHEPILNRLERVSPHLLSGGSVRMRPVLQSSQKQAGTESSSARRLLF